MRRFLKNWEFFLVVGLPIVLSPLLFIPDDDVLGTPPNTRPSTKFKCAYVLLLMAVYWMSEAMPLAVTSLIPMALFPLLGIQDTGHVSAAYMKETNMMFVGGLILAMTVEYCNLHRRIGLVVVTKVGCTPIRLMTGLMATTAFLSMWMSNTATAALMCPLAMAVLEEMFPKEEPAIPAKKRRQSIYKEESEKDFDEFLSRVKARRETIMKARLSMPTILDDPLPLVEVRNGKQKKGKALSFKLGGNENNDDDEDNDAGSQLHQFILEKDKQSEVQWDLDDEELGPREDLLCKKKRNMKKMLLYSILLSANVGGTGVITGTPPNLVFQELIKSVDIDQNGKYLDLTFATWMAYSLPPMCVNLFICWLYLIILYVGLPEELYFWRPKRRNHTEGNALANQRIIQTLEQKLNELGSMTFHEGAVLFLFVMTVILWLTRDPKFVTGWSVISDAKVGDSSAAILVVLLLFVIPRNLRTFCGYGEDGFVVKTPPLLDWKYVQLNLPWGIILLMGGGFALSSGVVYSGLSQWIGGQLEGLSSLPAFLILVNVMLLTSVVSEVTSNAACVNIIVPILMSLSEALDIHPLYLSIPITIASSYAFLLPIATPTNAIVFSAAQGDITIGDMVKSMFLPTVICMGILLFFHETYGNMLFNFGNYTYPGREMLNVSLSNSTM